MFQEVNFEISRQEYSDIFRGLKPGLIEIKSIDEVSLVVDKATQQVLLSRSRGEDGEIHAYMRAVIPESYCVPVTTGRVVVHNWAELEELLKELNNLQNLENSNA